MKRIVLVLILVILAFSIASATLAEERPLGGILPAATLVPPTKTPTSTPSPIPTNPPQQSQSQGVSASVSSSAGQPTGDDLTCHYDARSDMWIVLMCEVWPPDRSDSVYVPWFPGCQSPRYSKCR